MSVSVPIIDLYKRYKILRSEIERAVKRVFESGRYILGDEVKALENEIAKYCNVKYAVGVASGTDALELSLRALNIGKDDEVITTPFTFVATVEAILMVGARPVFCDIRSDTLNINEQLIKKLITRKTKAILPVHLYGQCAEMNAIMTVAKRYHLVVIEDACQAFGAEYCKKNGKWVSAGSIGDIGCFSFYPTKNLGCFGDGGMIVTNNAHLAGRLRKLRDHGSERKYFHTEVGYNSRLDEIQAAILRVGLKYVDRWSKKRYHNAHIYQQSLSNPQGELSLPIENSECKHIYHQFTVRTTRRDSLARYLKQKNIDCAIHYPRTVYENPCYQQFRPRKYGCPEAELAAKEVLSLPIHENLSKTQLNTVASAIKRFFLREES